LRLAVIKESGQSEVPGHTRRDPDGAAMGAVGRGSAPLKAGLDASTLGLGSGTI